MKKTDLAYFAGIFDGEGCIIINKCLTKRGNYLFVLQVQLVNINPWICQQLKFAFNGSVIPRKGARKNWRDYWAWSAENRQALIFLEAISPYLKLKKAEAEIAIKFQKSKRKVGSGWGKILTEAEMLLRENQRKELQRLKTL